MRKQVKMSVLKRILAVVIAVAVAVSMLTIPDAEVSAATGKVKSVAVTNLPAKQLTLKKGKSFTLKTKVSVSGKKVSKAVTYKTSNKKVATVNAKGKITAKKNGKAVITVISKANKKKTVKIKVTVGTPVTSIKLSKTKASLTVGKTLKLKATVAPKKASSKSVVWKTSNKKIATVSANGVVKGIKAGTVKITALAKDGSGKKKVCKVTVKKKQEVPAVITGLTALNDHSVQVSISPAKSLNVNDFVLYTKEYATGVYRKQCVIDSISSSDGVNYILTLNDETGLYEDHYVKVAIPKYGTEKEVYYTKGAFQYTDESIYKVAVGTKMDSSSGGYRYALGGYGFATATVSGLPAGVGYKVVYSNSYSYVQFYGSPVQAGVYNVTIVTDDELGNRMTETVTWLVYNDSGLYAAATPSYLVYGSAQGVDFSQYVTAAGGSGSYSYALTGTNYNCVIDSDGELHGTLPMAGDYVFTVVVTDKNNPALQTSTQVVAHVKQGVTIAGIVKDMNGNPVPYADISFTNQNKASRYSSDIGTSANSEGAYSITLEQGTYDIEASYRGTLKYLYSQSLQATQSGYDIQLPLYKVMIYSNNSIVSDSSFETWYDATGKSCGFGNTLYLKNGNYVLTSKTKNSIYDYTATAYVTVAGNSTMVTANVVISSNISTVNTGSNQSITVSPVSPAILKFTPTTSGYYEFYVPSVSGLDKSIDVYEYSDPDSSNDRYDWFDSSSSASITAYMYAGHTYYYKLSKESGNVANVIFNLTYDSDYED